MTLIVSVGNPDQFVQVSDRRLVSLIHKKAIEEESNKAFILNTDDARLVGGYAGTASMGSFNAREWILDALYECADEDRAFENILMKFRDCASQKFSHYRPLRNQPLTVMFSGWHYHSDPPLAFQARITNHMDLNCHYKPIGVQSEFQIGYHTLIRDHEKYDEKSFLINGSIGMPFKMKTIDKGRLREMVLSRKPAAAIRDKLIDVVRKYSNFPVSQGTVGGQLTSLILPRSSERPVLFGYHSMDVKAEIYFPDILHLTSTGRRAMKNLRLEPVDTLSTPPLSVPKAKPDAPCPCRSGLKYKKCHGNRGNEGVPFEFNIDTSQINKIKK